MDLVRNKLRNDLPELSTYFQTGGLVDAVVNLGLPAPIDIQVGGNNLKEAFDTATSLAKQIRSVKGVSDVLIPQDINYPGLELDVNREMAGRLGITSQSVIDNVITALTSNGMIAPSYWVDPKSGNNYLLTVQYPETAVKSLTDFEQIPLSAKDMGMSAENPAQPNGDRPLTTNLGAVTNISQINTPTEVDHYQLRRVIDIYVSPSSEDLGGRCESRRARAQECAYPVESGDLGARLGRGHEEIVHELRHRAHSFDRAGVPDSDGAVLVVHRSADHPSGDSAGNHRCDSVSAGDGDHAECDVADGRRS